ncbi:hypothetical protein PLIIFM63780_000764 [Purpureocillium lilacinum]|nr:hypothetical protein PLIIFM63780_000764 [Purpureocillium lilacinum]
MAGARPLLFLYPQLLRAAARSPYSSATGPRTWDAATAAATARAGRAKSSFAPRHGKGVEPAAWEQKQKGAQELEQEAIMMPPPPPPPPSQPQSAQPAAKEADAAAAATTTTTSNAAGAASADGAEAKGGREQQQQAPVAPELEIRDGTAAKAKAGVEASKSSATEAGKTDAEEGAAQPPQQQQQQQPQQQAKGKEGDEKGPRPSGPLDEVLLMQAPEHTPPQHPHMSPPPYVHHFDSYSLVKQLQEGGYSQEQATTAMKAIRTLLAQNLDVAQKSLVSKSDVENETYLFTAACSELGTEIKNNRRLQDEQMRQQRTHLQHEVDILTQSLNQELLTLTDNVRGMFNDRKMAVREEQKAVDSAIQKITYKMSILLSSDSKSEIEGVRWILIRRSVLGIIFMAILTLGVLRYATYTRQQRKKEADRRRREKEKLRKDGGKTDHSAAADAAAILAAN